MTTKRTTVTVKLPVDIEQGKAGLVYVTSPLVKGLMAARGTEKEALGDVQLVLDSLTAAIDEDNARVEEIGRLRARNAELMAVASEYMKAVDASAVARVRGIDGPTIAQRVMNADEALRFLLSKDP